METFLLGLWSIFGDTITEFVMSKIAEFGSVILEFLLSAL